MKTPPIDADSLRSLYRGTRRGGARGATAASLMSYVRQLCLLGVDSRMVMPMILEATGRLVGSDLNAFSWARRDYGFEDICVQGSLSYVKLGWSLYPTPEAQYRASREAYGADFPTAMRRARGYGNTARIARQYHNSAHYHNLFRPTGLDHTVELTVAQDGRGWGSLTLVREQGAPPFGPRQEQVLEQLAPYIAHAVRTPDRVTAMAESPVDTGVVEVDRSGRVVAESPGLAEVLLREPLLRQGHGAPVFAHLPVTEWFRELAARLHVADSDLNAGPPLLRQRTPWGEFTLRAYPLLERELAPVAARRFAIHIERREPQALRVLRGAFALRLSERQRELCLQLVTGASYTQIAGRMRLRPSTVIDHVRKIHDRLDVHDRQSLLHRLQEAAAHPIT